MSSILETKVQEIEKYTEKKLLNIVDTANYFGTDAADISELIKTGHIISVCGKYIRPVDIAKFELGIPSEVLHKIPEKPIDTVKNLVYPPSTIFKIEETIVSEEEYKMGISVGGSVFYNSTRQAWQAAFYIEEGGVKKRKIITGADEQDARKRMEILQSVAVPVVSNVLSVQPVQTKMLVRDYLRDVLKREICVGISYTTAQSYQFDCKYIYRHMGDRYIEDIKRAEIQSFLDNLKLKDGNPASDALKKRVYFMLSKMFSLAELEEIIRVNPMRVRIKIEKNNNLQMKDTLKSWLPFDLLEQILEAVKEHPIYHPLIVLLLHTGIRIGELIALKWDKIDFENNCITIDCASKRFKTGKNEKGETVIIEIGEDNSKEIKGKVIEKVEEYKIGDTKTGVIRDIPICTDLVELLRKHKENNKTKSEYVFPNNQGCLRSYDGLRCQMNKHWKKYGMNNENIRFHRFRHTTATLLRGAGTSEDVVASIMGHKRDNMTASVYMDIVNGLKEDAIIKYEEYLRQNLGIEVW